MSTGEDSESGSGMVHGKQILVTDDEPNMRTLFQRMLGNEGFQVTTAANAEDALQLLEQREFDLIISDLTLPRMNGLGLLKQAKVLHPYTPFIVVTGFGTVETAVEAMRQGAYDYIQKPFQWEMIQIVIRRALEQGELSKEVRRLRDSAQFESSFENIIGKSRKMQELFRLARRVAESSSTALIQGESGTGKELMARAIHNISPRRDQPFIAINAAGLPESLLESELFGHVKGAFTGAIRTKKGLFEEASGGTLFLDEIGDISLSMQSKLLRVLQEKEIKPVGSNEVKKIDVRVIAATNRDLKEAVKEKGFREDLYYRIAVITLSLPPLRDRREDIPMLADHFMKKYSTLNNKAGKTVHPQAMKLLLEHVWKGNVRELENVIERAVIISDAPEITPAVLPSELITPEGGSLPRGSENLPLRDLITQTTNLVEREALLRTLERVRWNKSKACKILGISRGALYNKIRLHGIELSSATRMSGDVDTL